MNNQPTQVPPNRKTHRLTIVVLVLVGLIALFVAYRLSLSFGIQRRFDSIRRAGLPATCLELDNWYLQPPPGENAADVFREVFAHYNSWTNKEAQFSVPTDVRDKSRFSSPPRSKHDLLPVEGTAKLPARTEPLPADMRQLIAEYLSDNAETLRLLHQAASMRSCRYPVDLTKGVTAPLRHLNSIRHAARLLELEAIQHTEEQHPQPAVESTIASLGVSRSLNQEPTLISYLVHIACQGIDLESLERILNRTPLTDEQLAKLATAIEESENQQAFRRAYVGERCMGVDIFQGLRTGKIPLKEISSMLDEEQPWPRFLIPVYRATGLLELDERAYLDIMEGYVKATQLLPPESIAAFHAVTDKVEHLTRWRVLSRMLLPALDKPVSKAGYCAAKIRDAETALAVERYRLANGKLPSQLSDLVPTFLPAVPSDPFDGKPLRYKTLAKGYVVYSVGEDREDNGGAEKNSKGVSYGPGTDITFTVER
jgi:hypothetical protein